MFLWRNKKNISTFGLKQVPYLEICTKTKAPFLKLCINKWLWCMQVDIFFLGINKCKMLIMCVLLYLPVVVREEKYFQIFASLVVSSKCNINAIWYTCRYKCHNYALPYHQIHAKYLDSKIHCIWTLLSTLKFECPFYYGSMCQKWMVKSINPAQTP